MCFVFVSSVVSLGFELLLALMTTFSLCTQQCCGCQFWGALSDDSAVSSLLSSPSSSATRIYASACRHTSSTYNSVQCTVYSVQHTTCVSPDLALSSLVQPFDLHRIWTFCVLCSGLCLGSRCAHFHSLYEETNKCPCNYIRCLLTTPTCFGSLLWPSSGCTVLKSIIKSCVCGESVQDLVL